MIYPCLSTKTPLRYDFKLPRVIMSSLKPVGYEAVHVAGLVVTSKATCFLKRCRDSDCRWDMEGCGMQILGECGLPHAAALQGDAGECGILHENQRCGSTSRGLALSCTHSGSSLLSFLGFPADFGSEVNHASCRMDWFANGFSWPVLGPSSPWHVRTWLAIQSLATNHGCDMLWANHEQVSAIKGCLRLTVSTNFGGCCNKSVTSGIIWHC